MELSRLTDPADPRLGEAMKLYRKSFPVYEQREQAAQEEILGCGEYHFDLILDGPVFVGILLYWEQETFLYLEHFCTCETLRGQGYGRRALELLAQKGKTVILEIDPPTDETAQRRKRFYQRAGYRENEFEHTHPPYGPGRKGHSLEVLSAPAPLSRAEYDRFNAYLQNRVMRLETKKHQTQ